LRKELTKRKDRKGPLAISADQGELRDGPERKVLKLDGKVGPERITFQL